jgi:hypothetical protein
MLTFWNSNLGILILSSVVIAPIGYFAKEYRDSQIRAADEQQRKKDQAEAERQRLADGAERYRQQVDNLCGEILHRMNQFRDINKLTGPTTPELFQLYSALPNAFPAPMTITASSAEFERTPTAAVVGQLESLTLADESLRQVVSSIRREHDAALSHYRDGDRVAAIQALQRQAQDLIKCRAEMENKALQNRQ